MNIDLWYTISNYLTAKEKCIFQFTNKKIYKMASDSHGLDTFRKFFKNKTKSYIEANYIKYFHKAAAHGHIRILVWIDELNHDGNYHFIYGDKNRKISTRQISEHNNDMGIPCDKIYPIASACKSCDIDVIKTVFRIVTLRNNMVSCDDYSNGVLNLYKRGRTDIVDWFLSHGEYIRFNLCPLTVKKIYDDYGQHVIIHMCNMLNLCMSYNDYSVKTDEYECLVKILWVAIAKNNCDIVNHIMLHSRIIIDDTLCCQICGCASLEIINIVLDKINCKFENISVKHTLKNTNYDVLKKYIEINPNLNFETTCIIEYMRDNGSFPVIVLKHLIKNSALVSYNGIIQRVMKNAFYECNTECISWLIDKKYTSIGECIQEIVNQYIYVEEKVLYTLMTKKKFVKCDKLCLLNWAFEHNIVDVFKILHKLNLKIPELEKIQLLNYVRKSWDTIKFLLENDMCVINVKEIFIELCDSKLALHRVAILVFLFGKYKSLHTLENLKILRDMENGNNEKRWYVTHELVKTGIIGEHLAKKLEQTWGNN